MRRRIVLMPTKNVTAYRHATLKLLFEKFSGLNTRTLAKLLNNWEEFIDYLVGLR